MAQSHPPKKVIGSSVVNTEELGGEADTAGRKDEGPPGEAGFGVKKESSPPEGIYLTGQNEETQSFKTPGDVKACLQQTERHFFEQNLQN